MPIIPHSLRKPIFISLLGHIALFSIFSLSFGNKLPPLDYCSVSFLGQFLQNIQVSPSNPKGGIDITKKSDTKSLDKVTVEPYLLTLPYVKPPLPLALNIEKELFVKKSTPKLFSIRKREPVIVFHPLLPYNFTLYFKDRQLAHVELMFMTESQGLRNSTLIKRKISSGNLEVDLLVMRYIGHLLFIQQPTNIMNNWQTVKIDLSAREN